MAEVNGGDAVREVRGESRTDRRDGSEVGHEGSRNPAGPEPGFQNPRLRGLGTGKWEQGKGCGRW